jgi:hypothetical protein
MRLFMFCLSVVVLSLLNPAVHARPERPVVIAGYLEVPYRYWTVKQRRALETAQSASNAFNLVVTTRRFGVSLDEARVESAAADLRAAISGLAEVGIALDRNLTDHLQIALSERQLGLLNTETVSFSEFSARMIRNGQSPLDLNKAIERVASGPSAPAFEQSRRQLLGLARRWSSFLQAFEQKQTGTLRDLALVDSLGSDAELEKIQNGLGTPTPNKRVLFELLARVSTLRLIIHALDAKSIDSVFTLHKGLTRAFDGYLSELPKKWAVDQVFRAIKWPIPAGQSLSKKIMEDSLWNGTAGVSREKLNLAFGEVVAAFKMEWDPDLEPVMEWLREGQAKLKLTALETVFVYSVLDSLNNEYSEAVQKGQWAVLLEFFDRRAISLEDRATTPWKFLESDRSPKSPFHRLVQTFHRVEGATYRRIDLKTFRDEALPVHGCHWLIRGQTLPRVVKG